MSNLDIEKYKLVLSANEVAMLLIAVNNQILTGDTSLNEKALMSAKGKLLIAKDQASKDVNQNFNNWLDEK